MIILGLDISTSIIGVCLYRDSVNFDLSHIDLRKETNLYAKADIVERDLNEFENMIIARNEFDKNIHIAIEEPLMKFEAGRSSAISINKLIEFNGIVSYMCHKLFKQMNSITFAKYSAASARKTLGIKFTSASIGGPRKEQVFHYLMNNHLKNHVFPCKKSGKVVDWAADAADAFVIANHAFFDLKK